MVKLARTLLLSTDSICYICCYDITVGCMRRFAYMNFQITTETNSKLSYTPCYMQCGFNLQTTYEELNLFVLFFVGGNLKFEYLYIE
jgi:hypothetical protein